MWWVKALEIASHLTKPNSIAAVALVLAAFIFYLALRSRKKVGLFWLFVLTAGAIVLLGLAPLASTTYLASRGIYRISVRVIGPDEQEVTDADVSSVPDVPVKKAGYTWEVDVPPQIRPADDNVLVTAVVKDAFLSGKQQVTLQNDYFPVTTIRLERLPSVAIHGVIMDERGRPISNAEVAVEGYSETARSNVLGNFQLSSHCPEGKIITIIATKGGLFGRISGPAGGGFEVTLRKP